MTMGKPPQMFVATSTLPEVNFSESTHRERVALEDDVPF